MQPVKIILSGCSGKMGRAVTEMAQAQENLSIIAGVDNFPAAHAYPVFSDFEQLNITGDVIIDFSRPALLSSLIQYAIKTKTPAVLATTGYSDQQLNDIKRASAHIPLFISGNMSLGVNLMLSLLKSATKILKDTFDIEIIEKHHNQKIDAPSGTALMIANAINETRNDDMKYTYDRHSQRKKREPNEIGIHAVRGGTIVGVHEVLFAGNDETVTISHSAASKTVFAEGSINAAIFVKSQKPGLYDMGSIVG